MRGFFANRDAFLHRVSQGKTHSFDSGYIRVMIATSMVFSGFNVGLMVGILVLVVN